MCWEPMSRTRSNALLEMCLAGLMADSSAQMSVTLPCLGLSWHILISMSFRQSSLLRLSSRLTPYIISALDIKTPADLQIRITKREIFKTARGMGKVFYYRSHLKRTTPKHFWWVITSILEYTICALRIIFF